ncbi:hypothetical protein Tco_1322558 [Tanacetum coccineum]
MDGGEDGDDDDENSPRDDTDDEDEDEEDEDEEDEEEEEEHLAPADSAIVVPTVKLVSPPEGIEPVTQPPSTNITTTKARITVRLQASISLPPEAEINRLLAMPTPPPSPLISLSPPSKGERIAKIASAQALVDVVTAALPSPLLPPLPLSLYILPPVDRRDDIPESKRPPRKRSCLFALGPRDTWVDLAEVVLEIAPMTLGEVNTRVTDLAELHEHDTQDLYALLEDTQDRDNTDCGGGGLCFPRGLGSFDAGTSDTTIATGYSYSDTAPGNEGVVGLTQWIEKMESVFNISGCAIENQVKFATCTLLGAALTWWNGQIRTLGPDAYSMTWEVKGNDVPTYTERFQELTLIYTKFVANETKKVDEYISGLPDNIYGNVKSSRPKESLDVTLSWQRP